MQFITAQSISRTYKSISLFVLFLGLQSCSENLEKQNNESENDTSTNTNDTASPESIDPIAEGREQPIITCSAGGYIQNSGISGSFCFAPIALGSKPLSTSSNYTWQVGSTLLVSP